MWRSAPEVDEADAIMAEQFMMYERQIEEYQMAAPISHWDGFSGLIKVSDEPLAQLLQKSSRQVAEIHPSGNEPAPANLISPFAVASDTQASEHGANSAAALSTGIDPLKAMLESARSLLSGGKAREAATMLRTLLASTPFKRVDISREAIELLLQTQVFAAEQGQSHLSPRQAALVNKEVAAALGSMARGEPRRALLILHKAREALGEDQDSREANQVALLAKYIESRHHI